MLCTVMLLESDTFVFVDEAKLAISCEESGTVSGVQLAAEFQSPLTGFSSHVALPARVVCRVSTEASNAIRAKQNLRQMRGRPARALELLRLIFIVEFRFDSELSDES